MRERIQITEGGVREIYAGQSEAQRRVIMENLYSKIKYGSDEVAIAMVIDQLHVLDPCDRCQQPMEVVKMPDYAATTKIDRQGILACPCAQLDPEGTGGRGLILNV